MEDNVTNSTPGSNSKVLLAGVLMLVVGVFGGMLLKGNTISQKAATVDSLSEKDTTGQLQEGGEVLPSDWPAARTLETMTPEQKTVYDWAQIQKLSAVENGMAIDALIATSSKVFKENAVMTQYQLIDEKTGLPMSVVGILKDGYLLGNHHFSADGKRGVLDIFKKDPKNPGSYIIIGAEACDGDCTGNGGCCDIITVYGRQVQCKCDGGDQHNCGSSGFSTI